MPLGLERCLQPRQQLVESTGELGELIVRPGQREALVQAGGGDPARGRGDGPQRAQHPAGHQPAEREGERGHDRQRDGGLQDQRVQVYRVHLVQGRELNPQQVPARGRHLS